MQWTNASPQDKVLTGSFMDCTREYYSSKSLSQKISTINPHTIRVSIFQQLIGLPNNIPSTITNHSPYWNSTQWHNPCPVIIPRSLQLFTGMNCICVMYMLLLCYFDISYVFQ